MQKTLFVIVHSMVFNFEYLIEYLSFAIGAYKSNIHIENIINHYTTGSSKIKYDHE